MAEGAATAGNRRGVKLPVIGKVNQTWVWAGAALIVGIVGYAYFTRRRQTPVAEIPEEAIPQDREPPPTVVGAESYDTSGVRDIISTNDQWYRSAFDYMVDVAGFEWQSVANALGKFLQRQPLTAAERDLVQVAKGATGEPPLAGPWPIITATPAPAAGATKWVKAYQTIKLGGPTTWYSLAKQQSRFPQEPNSVEAIRREILARNPVIKNSIGTDKSALLKKGWIVSVPVWTKQPA